MGGTGILLESKPGTLSSCVPPILPSALQHYPLSRVLLLPAKETGKENVFITTLVSKPGLAYRDVDKELVLDVKFEREFKASFCTE